MLRQRSRHINRFHRLHALMFAELALLTSDLAAGWALELGRRYPTAGGSSLARRGNEPTSRGRMSLTLSAPSDDTDKECNCQWTTRRRHHGQRIRAAS